MSSLKASEVSRNLQKKGFVAHDTDHTFYVFEVAGKSSEIRTKISHGEKEIGAHLINKMSKQLHLTKAEFVDFATCKISEEEYKEKLHNQGII